MATFTVTNLFDSGSGSLRNFISTANSSEGADIIDFDSLLSGTINLISGELGISDNLKIKGLGADQLTLDAGGNSPVFNVGNGDSDNDLDVTIQGLTITGGNYGGILNLENLTVSNSTISGNSTGFSGGGISNVGNLTVTNSTISGNTAYSVGGGIENDGNLTVTNSTISGNTATFGGGIYNFAGDITVTNSTISGNSASSGGGIMNGAIFSNDRSLTVTNSTISGNIANEGGGISNGDVYPGGDTATITSSTITGNVALGRGGGGVFNNGDLTVSNSTISGNTAPEGRITEQDEGGGGIRNEGYNMTVTNSTISGNTTGADGGGIRNLGYNMTVTNSTISGNTAGADGGGISNGAIFGNDRSLTVTNSTISGNTATRDGSGIYNEATPYINSTATVTSSIIAANENNKDIGGNDPFTSGGNNLIGNGDGAEGFTNGVKGDLVGTAANRIDPRLGSLQNNGGPTQTRALLPGSPAIDAGSNPLNLDFDQRGPGFDRVIGVQADIGAVEVVPEPDSTLSLFVGLPILGAALLRKRQRQQKTKPMIVEE